MSYNLEDAFEIFEENDSERDVLESDVNTTFDVISDPDIQLTETPRIKYITIETKDRSLHEVAVPPDFDYKPLQPVTGPSARTFNFDLDPFQEEAILCVENSQSVLVSAHTSAGKTVVADYCIAKSLKLKQKVIYTTPIKALSNQKYREFKDAYSDIGLMTGDVTISPNANCVIMTTEILRNMLYRGSELIREVAWVIFDEIHYMRDPERGYVWEETLILLPDNVHYIFLSATIPNARQFAEWIAYVHEQPCHVVFTDQRPVPLHHYVYSMGSDGIYLVVDDKGEFYEQNFNRAVKHLAGSENGSDVNNQQHKGKRVDMGSKTTNCHKVVSLIMDRNLAPVIVFSFSKKECELYAKQISGLDFNTSAEKKLLKEVFDNAMDILSEEDKNIPQVRFALPMLLKGIGVHHGGLLPLIKEVTEILFGEGLLKVLFATETFAMGLNMPARTVMFTALKKFDGKENRFVTSGEFVQMSGRAGRRGLDDRGTVVTIIEQHVAPATVKELFLGKVTPLNSAYQLTYNMILNLMRVDGINPEYMMERSFNQFQVRSKIPDYNLKIQTLTNNLKKLNDGDPNVLNYFHSKKNLERMSQELLDSTYHNKSRIFPYLKIGRLVKVFSPDLSSSPFDWGALVCLKPRSGKNILEGDDEEILIDVLTKVKLIDDKPVPCNSLHEEGQPHVLCVTLKSICDVSVARIYMPDDLSNSTSRTAVIHAIKEVFSRFDGNIPSLDPIEHMKIKDASVVNLHEQIKILRSRLESNPVTKLEDLEHYREIFDKRETLMTQLELLKNEVRESVSLIQMVELKNRKRVLQNLNFCNECDVISLKGRVACEISSCDELILTEMLFANTLNELSPHATVAMLSCLLCDQKTNTPKISDELQKPLTDLKDIARHLVKVYKLCNIDVSEDVYLNQLQPYFIELVYQWANGASFHEICTMADIFEGGFIRCLKRLEELLRQLIQAAKGIGNEEMESKFVTCIKLIKRGIAFAASLYL